MDQTNNCQNCVNAFVDPVWGEIKCREKERYCTVDEIKNGCDEWKGKQK